MNMRQIITILGALLLLSSGVLAMSSTNYAVEWFVPLTGAGGQPVASDTYAADFTVGQVAVGSASSANYAASMGYWYGVETAQVSDADLSVSKTDGPDPVAPNDTLTYTLSVRNNGPDDASGVTVVDELPSGVALESASTSQGSGCVGTGPVVCSLGDLPNGGSASVVIVVTAPTTTGMLSNEATASANEDDPDTGNNTGIASTTVGPEARVLLPLVLKD